MASTKQETDKWDDLDDLFDPVTGERKEEEPYLKIRPEGPITGAIFSKERGGRWIHVGEKRRRFNRDEDGSAHTNVVTNPVKRMRFAMKVEQAEIEELSRLVKMKKPPRHINPVSLIRATAIQKS